MKGHPGEEEGPGSPREQDWAAMFAVGPGPGATLPVPPGYLFICLFIFHNVSGSTGRCR